MKSLETDSPAPYIAMEIIESGGMKTATEQEPTRCSSFIRNALTVVESLVLLLLIIDIAIWVNYGNIKLTVEHIYKKPDWIQTPPPYPDEPIYANYYAYYANYYAYYANYTNPMWNTDLDNSSVVGDNIKYEEDEPIYVNEYEEDREGLSEIIYKLCSNIVPLEWPEDWKDDPQMLTTKMKEDLEFCGTIFGVEWNDIR